MRLMTAAVAGLRSPTRALTVLQLCAALLQTACCRTRPAVVPGPELVTPAPNFVAHVVAATRQSAIGPYGPYSQINLVVAIAPGTVGNAGVIVPVPTPVWIRHGPQMLTVAAADSIEVGDAIEVWQLRGPAFGSGHSPPGTPMYVANQIVIQR
jgi:hypothetical protein